MPTHQQKVTTLFDDWARAGRAEGMERSHEPAARPAFDRLEVGPGHRYLDVGCGNGYSVRWAVAAGAREAVGIDASEAMIERARQRSRELDNARFICGAFPSDQLEPASFDRVFSMEVFYYFEDLDGALAATRALLAPGGRFACVVDHFRENPASHSWSADLGLSLHMLGAAEWRDRLTRAGFADVEQERPTAASLVTYGRA